MLGIYTFLKRVLIHKWTIVHNYNAISLDLLANYHFYCVFPQSILTSQMIHLGNAEYFVLALRKGVMLMSGVLPLTSVHPLKGCRCTLGGSKVVGGWEE